MREGEIVNTIVWFKNEWCERLPETWKRIAGCRRCIPRRYVPEGLVPDIDEVTIVSIGARGEWVVKCDREQCCIYPWPKNLYAGWF